MKKFSVSRVGGTDGFAAFDFRGKQVTAEYAEKWEAEFNGAHWALRPGLTPERLRLKAFETGSNYRAWQGKPYYGVEAFMCKHPQTGWTVILKVDGVDRERQEFKTRKAALEHIAETGAEQVETVNILNREFGPIMISRSEKGGCTDPGTERYHCM